jgi:ferredoxin
MSRPVWLVTLIKRAFPGRFLAGKTTHLPLIGRLIDHALFAGDDVIYLPRDHTITINQSIPMTSNVVVPSRVVEHFIEQASYHWIMDTCLCRDASKCKDYPIDLGCLFLGEAVLGINPKLGRQVTKAEALAHARRCREAGLVHLIGRNKLDTVWLGVGPGDKLLTICNCCPCCCLWRVLPTIAPGISAKIARMPGVEVSVTESCTGCGICADGICFVDAIHLVDGRAVIGDACRGCGHCVEACPQEAIILTIEDDGVVEKVIGRLSSLVDVG